MEGFFTTKEPNSEKSGLWKFLPVVTFVMSGNWIRNP